MRNITISLYRFKGNITSGKMHPGEVVTAQRFGDWRIGELVKNGDAVRYRGYRP
jgi:hypothetical protein